jgi:DNA invertase Pin-like site-specific DNA recombinase
MITTTTWNRPYKPNPNNWRQKNKLTAEEHALIDAYRAEKAHLEKIAELERFREEVRLRGPTICGYIRCSHVNSAESGLGLAAQRTIITRWAEFIRVQYPDLNPEIRWYVDEVQSAFKKKLCERPNGIALNAFLHAGDHVIFAYLNRAFRNTVDCLNTVKHWKQRGVIVHFVDLQTNTSTASGELILTVIAASAQMESANVSERILAAFAELQKHGRTRGGHAPYGWKLLPRQRIGEIRKMVPDWKARKLGEEIVRAKDEYGFAWYQVMKWIDAWLRNKKKMPPRGPYETYLIQSIDLKKKYIHWKRLMGLPIPPDISIPPRMLPPPDRTQESSDS